MFAGLNLKNYLKSIVRKISNYSKHRGEELPLFPILELAQMPCNFLKLNLTQAVSPSFQEISFGLLTFLYLMKDSKLDAAEFSIGIELL